MFFARDCMITSLLSGHLITSIIFSLLTNHTPRNARVSEPEAKETNEAKDELKVLREARVSAQNADYVRKIESLKKEMVDEAEKTV